MSAISSYEMAEILQNSEIQVVAIGGDDDPALSLIKSGQLGDFFASDSPLTSAVPISYTLRNVGDNEIATVSETVNYDMVHTDNVHVEMFPDENQWRSAVQIRGLDDLKWLTTKDNIYKANEAGIFYNQAPDQTFMYNHSTLSGSVTGYPFNFFLENTAVGYDYRALVHNDDNGAFTTTTISIGNYNNNEFCNDDFKICKVIIGF